MSFKVEISKLARSDIQKAIRWYEGERVGLGRRFHASVKAIFEHLTHHPFFEVRYDDVRFILVPSFPYSVHFTVDEAQKKVFVKGVFHTSLDPDTHWENDRRDSRD